MKCDGAALIEVRPDIECRLHTETAEQIARNERGREAGLKWKKPRANAHCPPKEREGRRPRKRRVFGRSLSFRQPLPGKDDKRHPCDVRYGHGAPENHSLERRQLTPPPQKPSHAIRRN